MTYVTSSYAYVTSSYSSNAAMLVVGLVLITSGDT